MEAGCDSVYPYVPIEGTILIKFIIGLEIQTFRYVHPRMNSQQVGSLLLANFPELEFEWIWRSNIDGAVFQTLDSAILQESWVEPPLDPFQIQNVLATQWKYAEAEGKVLFRKIRTVDYFDRVLFRPMNSEEIEEVKRQQKEEEEEEEDPEEEEKKNPELAERKESQILLEEQSVSMNQVDSAPDVIHPGLFFPFLLIFKNNLCQELRLLHKFKSIQIIHQLVRLLELYLR